MVWVCIDWADVQITLFGEEEALDQELHKQFSLLTLSHRGDFDWLIGLVVCYYYHFLQVRRMLVNSCYYFVLVYAL